MTETFEKDSCATDHKMMDEKSEKDSNTQTTDRTKANEESEHILFKNGFYGKKVGFYKDEMINRLNNNDRVEFIDKNQIESLKNDFMLDNLNPVETITNDTIIRLKTKVWREMAVGPDIKFQRKYLFDIINYCIINQDRDINVSEIKNQLDIGPKEISYTFKFCKKHKILDIQSDGLIKYIYKAKEAKVIDIFGENKRSTLPCLYKNYTVEEILINELEVSIEGVTSSMIHDKYGRCVKFALKDLQALISKYPDKYVTETVFVHKSQTLAFFTVENHKIYKENKTKRLKGNKDADKLKIITTKDKEFLVLEKLKANGGTFMLDNVSIMEMSKIAGVDYMFDKKNLVRMIKKAGLNMLSIGENPVKKIVYNDKYTEEEVCEMFKDKDLLNTQARELNSKLKALIVNNPQFITSDNLYVVDQIEREYKLFECLGNKKNSVFTKKNILDMKIETFLFLNRIPNKHFLQMIALELYKKKPEEFNLKNLESKLGMSVEQYSKNWDGSLFKSDKISYSDIIAPLVDQIKHLKIKSIANLENAKHFKQFNIALNPLKLKSLFQVLEHKKLINLKIDNKVVYTKLKEIKRPQFTPRKHINYQTRYKIYQQVCELETVQKVKDELQEMIKNDKKLTHFIGIILLSLDGEREDASIDISNLTDQNKKMIKATKYLLFKNDLKYDSLENIIGPISSLDLKAIMKHLRDKSMILGATNFIEQCRFVNKIVVLFKDTDIDEISFNNYYSIYHSILYPFIQHNISIDLGAILQQFNFIEPFELEEYFEVYAHLYSRKDYFGLTVITSKSE